MLTLGMATITTLGFALSETPATYEQKDDDKVEINAKELPKEVKMDILDNYHAAEIVKAYKTTNGGKLTGYVVEIKKGPKEWTVTYDKDGNPENKINPI
ncbi:MAG: hypothetical protein CMI36_10160 [Owenweeksia sp.]|nr:hypothetical protein [Owenweeksia sp.]MBF99347.1 hypothetical protein [Owenweeksia sp.]HBF20373.1 hypothetical protein [Cryomorphaceae bacterium]HCQ14802.1 hypothetical protein [Cryomorphaceae bacterium]|tara:strand:- start:841 stop:1137 length:297 start_codon:yes stop_codon:yes gene_type:complete